MRVSLRQQCIALLSLSASVRAFVEFSGSCRAPLALFSQKTEKRKGRSLTPAQKAIQKTIREEPGDFDKFKNVVYGSVDGIQNIGKSVGKLGSKEEKKVFDGYSEIEKRSGKPGKTPTQRILQTLKDRPPTNSPPTSRTVFESMKGAVYGTIDAASRLRSKDSEPAEALKPVVRAKQRASKEVLDSLPDLDSPNPVKRLAAESKLKLIEIQENYNSKVYAAQSTVSSIKEALYNFWDAVEKTIDALIAFPGKAVEFFENVWAFLQTIPGKVQNFADGIKGIPGQVEQKVTDVKKSVDSTVQTTKQVVEDVKAFPGKVQETAENTKKTIKGAVETVDEVIYDTKVLLKLEKPKPKPPKSPPPEPLTPGKIAFKIAGTLASVAGKTLWWVGKEAAKLTASGVAKGAEIVKEKIDEKQKENAKPVERTTSIGVAKAPRYPAKANASAKEVQAPAAGRPTPKTKGTKTESSAPKATVKKSDDTVTELDRQVQEALDLAREALADDKDEKPEAEKD